MKQGKIQKDIHITLPMSRKVAQCQEHAMQEQHRRFDIRLNDLLAGLKSMEKVCGMGMAV